MSGAVKYVRTQPELMLSHQLAIDYYTDYNLAEEMKELFAVDMEYHFEPTEIKINQLSILYIHRPWGKPRDKNKESCALSRSTFTFTVGIAL